MSKKKNTQKHSMDENGDGEDLTPFWLQSTSETLHTDRLRRRVSSLFFSSGLVVLLLLVTALFFLVFVVPAVLSFSAQIFRPNSVKKSWDSLNIVLVLVAVLFGFLTRIQNEDRYSYYDESQASPNKQNESQRSKPPNSDQWYSYNYSTVEGPKANTTSVSNLDSLYEHSDYQMKLEKKDSFLTRNSSSYPDLREFSFSSNRWDSGDYRRGFYDDLNVDAGRVPDPVKLRHRRHRSVEEIDSLRAMPKTKTIFVDTLVGRSKEAMHSSLASSPPLPTPAQPPAPPEYEEKQQSDSVARREKRLSRKQKKDSEPMNPITELKPPQPMPPPPTSAQQPAPMEAELPALQEMPKREHEIVRRSKARPSRKLNEDLQPKASSTPPPPPPPPPPQEKISKSGSATKDFLNSFYHKKKKKPRQKSAENLDSLLHQAQEPISFQLPPPTVSPSPSTAFQNMFLTKKQKRKRTITVTLTPTPPPPPPPPPPPRTTAKETKPTSQTSNRVPQKMKMFEKYVETSNSGGESPLNRIPPPPPPPPPAFFKDPTWKFVVQGDYVRVDSSTSSTSGSPDINDVDSDVTPSADEGAMTPFHPSPLFCQSPDVDTKAESFISSFRAKLKLEKIHSMNGRQLGLSGLGPNPN